MLKNAGAAAAVLLALALFAPAARADAPVAWQHRALATAEHTWHPACGQLTISFDDPTLFGGDNTWGGWAYAGNCTIHEPASHHWLGYPEFCTDVLHEAGHAAGSGHRPRGIMRAERSIVRTEAVISSHGHARDVVQWAGVDRRCLPRD